MEANLAELLSVTMEQLSDAGPSEGLEDLEQDPRRTLEEVCVFAGLPTDSAIIDRIVARDASGDSAAIPLRGECAEAELVEPRGFGGGGERPRLEGRALKRCLAIAGSRLESLGYDSSGVSR